jgi:hypothetical protein
LATDAQDNAVIAYFYTATGIPVIWEKQDAPRPDLPYVSLSILDDSDKTGHRPDQTYDGLEQTYTFINEVQIRARIYCNTDVYMGYLRDCVRFRQKYEGKAILKAAGINIREVGNIQDISSMIDTNFELRANADFYFTYKSTSTEDIEQVKEINGEFNDVAFGQVIFTET